MLEMLGFHPSQLIIQIVAFACLYFLLKKVLYGPIVRVLDERAQRIGADRDEAAALRAAAATTQAELEQRLGNIESEARDRMQVAEREARAAREQMLAEARAEREKLVAAGLPRRPAPRAREAADRAARPGGRPLDGRGGQDRRARTRRERPPRADR